MPNLNASQIQDYISQNYPGIPVTSQLVSEVMNYRGGDPNTMAQAVMQTPEYQQFQTTSAQNTYNQQQGSAISTLQTGKANLADQYSSLLQTVNGEYQPLIDQATLQSNAQNASRGLVSNVGNGGTQMLSALNPIYSAQAANAQQIGQGSITDTNTYNNAISQAQQTGASTNAALPLEYGSLSLNQQALPSQIALAQAQAKLATNQANTAGYLPNYNGITFNTGNNSANVLGQNLNLSSSTLQAALASMGL